MNRDVLLDAVDLHGCKCKMREEYVQVNFRMPKDLKADADRAAEARQVTLTELFTLGLRHEIIEDPKPRWVRLRCPQCKSLLAEAAK